jgi:hypothetical protein
MGSAVVNNKMLIITLAVLVLLLSSCVKADRHTYINIYSPMSMFIIDQAESSFNIVDRATEAKFCEKNDAYYCVTSVAFNFHVPKVKLALDKEWKVDGKVYEIVSRFRDGLGGFSGMVYIIERQEENTKLKFLYSRQAGLVGFGGVSKDSSAFYMLSSNCGFGHSQDCAEKNYEEGL